MKAVVDALGPAFWSMTLIAAGVYGLHLYREEGYDEGYALAEAKGAAALSTLRETYAVEQRDVARQNTAQLLTERQRGDLLASQLADARIAQRQATERLTGEISRVTSLYRRTLESRPEPLPTAVFTAGFVRVWNTANGVATGRGLPSTKATGRTPASTGPTTAVDQLDSGVTQGNLLNNHTRNAELYASCRAQLNNLIDWNNHANQ